MSKIKSLIGSEIDRCQKTIEANQLTQLNRTFYQPNPFCAENQKSVPADEQFQQFPPFLLGNLINTPTIYNKLGLNINQVLLSRESVTAHHPLSVGDCVTISTFLKDAYEQQASSNPIGFVVLASIGSLKSDIAFLSERVFAVRGGFQRGRLV